MAGGPLYNLARRLGVTDGRAGFVRLGVALALLTWLPLLALTSLEHDESTISFLQSLGTHTRLLVAIPLFFAAEALFDARVRQVIVTIVAARLVPAARLSHLDAALLQTIKWRDAWIVEAALLVITMLSISNGLRTDLPGDVSTWRTTSSGSLTPAGLWYSIVSFPVFQFLLWRWCARMLIWWQLLWRISRLDLRLIPTHPDFSGGLGGFGVAHVTLAPLGLGSSAVLVASFAEDIWWGGSSVSGLVLPLTSAVCANVFIVVAPLLTFSPRLFQLKQQGLLEYGGLAAGYVSEFDDKWLRKADLQRERLLGSPDLQSLADLANSFNVIRSMRIVPIALSQVLLLVGAAALPAAPLVLFVVPLDELVVKVLRAFLNV